MDTKKPSAKQPYVILLVVVGHCELVDLEPEIVDVDLLCLLKGAESMDVSFRVLKDNMQVNIAERGQFGGLFKQTYLSLVKCFL